MAEITRLRQGQMLQGVMQVLDGYPDGLPAGQAMEATALKVVPTPFEDEEYPNRPGDRRFPKILRFTTINAVKAGWLIKHKGTWTLTDDGRVALKKYTDPEALMREAARLYKAWKNDQPDTITEDDDDPLVQATATLEEAQEAAWQEIASYLGAMNPYDFQDMIAALLRAMGYHVSHVSPPGPDRGLDVLAFTDPFGASGPRIKVQVKRTNSGKINVDGVRSFMATLGQQDVGIFVALGGFTGEAEKEARFQETRRITLVDAAQLVDLWIEHYGDLDDADRHHLPLQPVHYLAPRD